VCILVVLFLSPPFVSSVRQSSNPESGNVEIQLDLKSEKWERKWMTFDESVIYFYRDSLSRDKEWLSISMDKVISFRADNVSPLLLLDSFCL
jgi:hypothetical protein